MNYYVIIPARFASSRLPGKPLVDIGGKSMIQRTYEQCLKAAPAEKIYVATDDERIAAHCRDRGINVVMTSPDCLTGTDRVAEAAKVLEADYYINVQGDEPVIPPDDIRAVIRAAEKGTDEIIAGYTEILDEKDYFSPAIPKMVLSEAGYLMYMSRAPIPGNKKMGFEKAWRQVCVYAFSRKALEQFTSRTKKTEIEQIEDLELLRFLEMGIGVKMIRLSAGSIAVDNPEDVEKVLAVLKNGL